jgi:hypothetical protein
VAATKLPRGTKVDGIFFTEASELNGMQVIGPIEWSAVGQNQDLRYVKAGLAAAAKKLGANAVVEYKYGQRGRGWFGSLGGVDGEKWYGSGLAVKIDPALVKAIPDKASGKLQWKGA